MNHIGNIIHEFRNSLHLTRQELSAEICSEKYLYMIEKGDRTPSTEVMRRLEDRMGVAILKYYEYPEYFSSRNVYTEEKRLVDQLRSEQEKN